MGHPVRIHILQRQRLVPGYRRHAGHHIRSAEHHSLPERGFNRQDEEFVWDCFLIGRYLLQSFCDYEDSERIENIIQAFVKKEDVTWLAGTSTTPPLPQFLKHTREKSPILGIVRLS